MSDSERVEGAEAVKDKTVVDEESYEGVEVAEQEVDYTEEAPEAETPVERVLLDFDTALDEAEREVDENTLAGTAIVTLAVNVHEAETPQEAVDSLLAGFIRRGLAGFIWRVKDMETGREWNVLDGELFTDEELAQIAEEPLDGDSED